MTPYTGRFVVTDLVFRINVMHVYSTHIQWFCYQRAALSPCAVQVLCILSKELNERQKYIVVTEQFIRSERTFQRDSRGLSNRVTQKAPTGEDLEFFFSFR